MSASTSEVDSQLQALFAKRGEIIKPGLSRIKTALSLLPWADRLPPALLIGGTNGKGSTSGMLWHLLAGCQLRVGLFSSPHLCHFAERIQCSHREIDNSYVLAELHTLKQLLPTEVYAGLSFFEVNTLLALQTFTRENCDFMVVEVGLGGRWDATNSIEPCAAAITSIDKDHEQWLGDSLTSIAMEKLGIARPHKPLFWGERFTENKTGVGDILSQEAERKEFVLYRRGEHFTLDQGILTISIPELPLYQQKLPDFFAHFPPLLQQNFALSLSLFYWLVHQKHLFPQLHSHAMDDARGIFTKVLSSLGKADTPWPPSLIGRFQRLTFSRPLGAPELICDVGHNPAGITEFLHFLHAQGLIQGEHKKIPGFFSCLHDKDISGMLDLVRPYVEPLVLFQIGSERTISSHHLPARHADLPLFADFSKAWHYAYRNWQGLSNTWSICGSVAAIGEVITYFNAFPPHRYFQKNLLGCFPDLGDRDTCMPQ